MFLEDILKDGFVNYKKVYELAEENGIKKTEVKRQKALLGVKSVHVDGEEGGTLWLWFIPKNVWKDIHRRSEKDGRHGGGNSPHPDWMGCRTGLFYCLGGRSHLWS